MCLLTWSAYTIDVRNPSLWARADHGPYRYGIQNVATCVLQARLDDGTGIDALLPDAHQFIGAVNVEPAFRLLDLVHGVSFAVGERISQRYILGATTGHRVILHVADRILRAG